MAPGHAHHRRRRGSHATTSHEPSVDPALVENLELEARPAVHRRAQSLPPPTVFASQQDISQQFAAEEGFPFDFLYKPHTSMALVLSLGVVFYCGFWAPQKGDPHWKRGLASVCVVFLMYCVVQLRDSVLVRPHPAIWRLVHGVGILYLLALVFMVTQSETSGRTFLTQFDPRLRYQDEQNDKLYATDCRIYTPENKHDKFANVTAAFFDLFVVAHFLGSLVKTLILRDWKLALALLLVWEVMEYSFQHLLPNFAECWWDHWILDAFGVNLAGLVLGILISNWLSVQHFDWTGYDKRPMWRAAIRQLGPSEWMPFDWQVFSSFRRFIAVVALVFFFEIGELNGFFLKYVFYMPPENPINVFRLVLLALLAVPAFREYYEFSTNPAWNRLGLNVWLYLCIMVTEVACIVKYGANVPNFHQLPPKEVFHGWLAFGFSVAVWAALRYQLLEKSPMISETSRRIAQQACVALGIAGLGYIVATQDVGKGAGKKFSLYGRAH